MRLSGKPYNLKLLVAFPYISLVYTMANNYGSPPNHFLSITFIVSPVILQYISDIFEILITEMTGLREVAACIFLDYV